MFRNHSRIHVCQCTDFSLASNESLFNGKKYIVVFICEVLQESNNSDFSFFNQKKKLFPDIEENLGRSFNPDFDEEKLEKHSSVKFLTILNC